MAIGEQQHLYRSNDIGVAPSGGAAALKLDMLLPKPTIASPRPLRTFMERLATVDLIVDLGRNIGSPRWLRGAATCTALCAAAVALGPSFEPILASSPAPLTDAQWEEARTLSIAPLAYGADTGRRLGATEAVELLSDAPERPSLDLLAALAPDDGFARALRRSGITQADAGRAAALVGAVMPLSEVGLGTAANITLGRRPSKGAARPLDMLTFRARLDLKLELRRVNGELTLNRVPIAVDNSPLRFQGRVGPSLYRSARAAGAPTDAVETYIRALATQIDVGQLRSTDRFDIIIAHRRAATGETETGKLQFAGLSRGSGTHLRLMPWSAGGRTQWFDASGEGQSSGTFQRPVPGTVSSNYGMRRHPILGYSRMHKGMDFRAGYGTPILASASGRVMRAGWAGGYGQQVRIAHGNTYATSYSHMSRMVVSPGESVRQGQLIGYVGSTGLSTGPHLHYELYYQGRQVDPASAKFIQANRLSGSQLASFRSRLRSLMSVPVTVGAGSNASVS